MRGTPPAPAQAAGLAHVERALFQDDAPLGADPAGLALLAANSVQGELREIARRIKTLLTTGGALPEEIAVVFRNLDELAPRLREVCDDFGLPAAIGSRATLAQTALVRSLVKLLRLHEQDWPFDLLIDVVGNRFFHWGVDQPGSNWRVAAERSLRRAQLPAGRTLVVEQLRAWGDDGPEATAQARDAAVALPVFAALERVLEQLPERAPLAAWIPALEQLLTTGGLAATDPHWQRLRRELELTVATDTQLESADAPLTVVELRRLVETLATEVPLAPVEDSVGRVRFLAAQDARNLIVRHLFLAGLGEQSYSSGESAGRLYRAQEVERFVTTELARDISPEQQAGDAMLLFYEMVTRGTESLTLSYPALDDKGQTLSPSPFVTELLRCFPPAAIPEVTLAVELFTREITAPLGRSEWRVEGLGAAQRGNYAWLAGMLAADDPRTPGGAILDGVGCVGSRSEREDFGPFEGILSSRPVHEELTRRFAESHLWSPSQLETYATCPFRFFAGQLLKLQPLEEIALRSDHLRKGNLLHQVLAAVHQQLGTASLAANEADLVARFTSALEAAIASTPLSKLEEALREIERREVQAWAPQYAEQEVQYRSQWTGLDEPLRPAHFEVRFGPRTRSSADEVQDPLSQPVPFTLDLGEEQIQLTGQIDRIDVGRVDGVTVFTIIDYKSGKPVQLKPAEMEAGRQLQLPLYALAAEKLLLADQHALALAGGYWGVKEKGFAAGGKDKLEVRKVGSQGLEESAAWPGLQEAMAERIVAMVHGVREGAFPVYNEDQKCTASCEYSKLCRVAQIRSLEKVWIPSEDT